MNVLLFVHFHSVIMENADRRRGQRRVNSARDAEHPIGGRSYA
ncbi:hypothetical protein [Dactylosporangium sp. NPDC051484]